MDRIDLNNGLTKDQVETRFKEGKYNYNDVPKTKTVGQIIRDNFSLIYIF